MWSDVRGRLLTLRPLSVLSLREWALQENAHKLITEPRSASTNHIDAKRWKTVKKKKGGSRTKGTLPLPSPDEQLRALTR